MCGVAYTPYAMNDKPKIHGVAEIGESPPTGGWSGRRQGTRGDTYAE